MYLDEFSGLSRYQFRQMHVAERAPASMLRSASHKGHSHCILFPISNTANAIAQLAGAGATRLKHCVSCAALGSSSGIDSRTSARAEFHKNEFLSVSRIKWHSIGLLWEASFWLGPALPHGGSCLLRVSGSARNLWRDYIVMCVAHLHQPMEMARQQLLIQYQVHR